MMEYVWIGFTFGIGAMFAGVVTSIIMIAFIAVVDRIENKE